MDNTPRYYEVLWAAQRSGLRFTAVSSKLTAGEVEYIVKDCEAKALVCSKGVADVALQVAPLIPGVKLFMVDGAAGPYESFEEARSKFPTTPIADEGAGRGDALLVGHHRAAEGGQARRSPASTPIDAPNGLAMMGQMLYGWTPDSVYLSPAPLYHAAPLGWSMAVQALGGTVVLMERFDPEDALRLIEKHKVTTAQWVPTHFVRMLKLPEERAGEVRRLLAEAGVPRRRALPGADQGADDRLVGPDHQRVLRRHRGQRLHRHQLGRVAGAQGLGRHGR